MLDGLTACLLSQPPGLLAASLVSNTYGIAPTEEELGRVVGTALLGGFCGLAVGLVIAEVLHYLTFLSGRNFGGYLWTAVGAFVGMAVFTVLALTGNAR
jgi:hypothetical protein